MPHPPLPPGRRRPLSSPTPAGRRPRALFDHFLAGLQATLRELTLLYARTSTPTSGSSPVVRAHRGRLGPGQPDLRLRVVGHGAGLRVENRVPGGDVNPYLALAAMIAGGLHGIANECPSRSRSPATRMPRIVTTFPYARRGRDLFAGSTVARAAFGDEVVDHYVNAADIELAAFNSAVTDWERVRGFERL